MKMNQGFVRFFFSKRTLLKGLLYFALFGFVGMGGCWMQVPIKQEQARTLSDGASSAPDAESINGWREGAIPEQRQDSSSGFDGSSETDGGSSAGDSTLPFETNQDDLPTEKVIEHPEQTVSGFQIKGTIHCKRCGNKKILVAALGDLTDPGGTLLGDVIIAKAGPYTLTLPKVPSQAHLLAFVDDNMDGQPDEPGKEALYTKNPIRPQSSDRTVDNIDIYMDGTPSPQAPPCRNPFGVDVIIPVVSSISVDGKPDDWRGVKPLLSSPRGAYCQGKKPPSDPGLDLKRVYMARWNSWYFGIETQAFFANKYIGMRIELLFTTTIAPTKMGPEDVKISLIWDKSGWTHSVNWGTEVNGPVGGASVVAGSNFIEAVIPEQWVPELHHRYLWVRLLPGSSSDTGDQTQKALYLRTQPLYETLYDTNGKKIRAGLLFVRFASGTSTTRIQQIATSIGAKIERSYTSTYTLIRLKGLSLLELQQAREALGKFSEVDNVQAVDFLTRARCYKMDNIAASPQRQARLCFDLKASERFGKKNICERQEMSNKKNSPAQQTCIEQYTAEKEVKGTITPKGTRWPLEKMRFAVPGKGTNAKPYRPVEALLTRCVGALGKKPYVPSVAVIDDGSGGIGDKVLKHGLTTVTEHSEFTFGSIKEHFFCRHHGYNCASAIAAGPNAFTDGAFFHGGKHKLHLHLFRCPRMSRDCLNASVTKAIALKVDLINNSWGSSLKTAMQGYFKTACKNWGGKITQKQLYDDTLRRWEREHPRGECREGGDRTCNADSDCTSGQKCVGQLCMGRGGKICSKNSDCPKGQKCIGDCTKPTSQKCTLHNHCSLHCRKFTLVSAAKIAEAKALERYWKNFNDTVEILLKKHNTKDRTFLVFSAGNEDISIATRPTTSENLVFVGALGTANQRTCFSNYDHLTGDVVPLWAPGGTMSFPFVWTRVSKTSKGKAKWESKGSPGEIVCSAGTSYAAPLVTAVGALMRLAHKDIPVEDLRTRLIASQPRATRYANNTKNPKGGVDALIAVASSLYQGIGAKTKIPTSYRPAGTNGHGVIFSWTAQVTSSSCDWGKIEESKKIFAIPCQAIPKLKPVTTQQIHSVDAKGKKYTLSVSWSVSSFSGFVQGDGVTPGIGDAKTTFSGKISKDGRFTGTMKGSGKGLKNSSGFQNCKWSGKISGLFIPTRNPN